MAKEQVLYSINLRFCSSKTYLGSLDPKKYAGMLQNQRVCKVRISVNFANSLNYKELSDALLINVEFQHFFSKCDAPKIHFCRFSFSELLSSLRISLDFVKCKTKYILMYPIFPSIITPRLQYLKPTALLLLYNIESLHLVS